MAKGRRRRWIVPAGVMVCLVWLFGWQGLGWFAGPGDTGDSAPKPVGGGGGGGGDNRAGGNAQLAVSSMNGTGARTDPSTTPDASADRVRGLFALVSEAADSGELGGGFHALADLEELALAGAQGTAVGEARESLAAHLESAVASLRADVLAGRLRAARTRAGGLLRIEHAAVAQALQGLCDAQDWPALVQSEPPSGYVPKSTPIAADRVVRVLEKGAMVPVRVADSLPHEVTVRLQNGGGVTFPSYPVTEVELVDASAADAAEMGLAALQAKDTLLARLWLCYALAQGGAEQARCVELRELLDG